MNAHRIEILNRTDNGDVVVAIAQKFQLVLLPAHHRLVNHDLVDGAQVQAPGQGLIEISWVVIMLARLHQACSSRECTVEIQIAEPPLCLQKLLAVACGAIGMPMDSIRSRKRSRFSVISIASISTPIIRTSCSFQMPISSH